MSHTFFGHCDLGDFDMHACVRARARARVCVCSISPTLFEVGILIWFV